MSKGKLLIVDDNSNAIKALKIILASEFDIVKGITNPNVIPAELGKNEYDVILLDMNFQDRMNRGNEGFYWLRQIKERYPETEVVLLTAYGDVDLAVRAMKEGAADFIQKPWDNERVVATLNSASRLVSARKEVNRLKLRQAGLKDELNRTNRLVIGSSPLMLNLMQTVRKVASTDANVLITGENGTGKEVIAREIHRLSKRSKEVLVSVDMGTVPENLFESELFGFKKGAFTDAREDKIGKFELANGGTLFLDEIGNLPVGMQSKLLVALQQRKIIPLGSSTEVPIDFRLISATNSPVNMLAVTGEFREDLLYRINTIQLEIPPLRERLEDIEVLANHFLRKYCGKYHRDSLAISRDVFPKLRNYHWPGNIRELEHTIERTVILSNGNYIHREDIHFSPAQKDTAELPETIREMEELMIRRALIKYKGNYSAAAKQLGISRQTLYYKGKKHDF